MGSSGEGVLIDAGRSAKQIENVMRECDIPVSSIKAIFVTHEHIDHVQGLRVFASRYDIKVYASQGTIEALNAKGIINGKFKIDVINENGVDVGGMHIDPFNTSHDSFESLGYIVTTSDGKKSAVATDMGFVSDLVHNAIKKCEVALIESNHDVRMLQNGSYPYNLKRRILSNIGHLSNDACASEIVKLVKDGVSRFVLAHLSDENNVPELAYQTTFCSLTTNKMVKGKDFDLFVAPKENYARKMFIF